MSPMEIVLSLSNCIHFSEIINEKLRRYKLEILEKMRDDSQVKLIVYQ